ncbi:MAG: ABC transporter substrate-binding protein [Burkholderiaceae bacterium]|nr:ABC transporter substrate-binding protein [Burkholderiaceae bacterium]
MVCTTSVGAVELTLMVGDNPPFNSFTGSKPEGMAVEIVDTMLARARISDVYISYPWARAYNLAQAEPNHCVFTLGRLPERENLFQWIGPIAFNQWGFFALRERNLNIKTLDDARKYTIGGQRKDAKAMWLEKQGFTIDLAPDEKTTLKKLLANRVDLYPAGIFTADDIAKRLEIDPKRLQMVLVFNHVDNYIGCSKNTDPIVIVRLQKALNTIRADKTINKIWEKYEADFAKPAN